MVRKLHMSSVWRGLCLAVGLSGGLAQAAPAGDAPNPGSDVTVDSLCKGVYGPGWQALGGQVSAAIPVATPLPKGVAWKDPVHRTCLLRVTDHATEGQVGAKGLLRNDYSRRQAFNANSTLLLAEANNGYWHLYDAQSLRHLKILPGLAGDAEPQWHPTDPDRLYFVPINGVGMKLLELNVKTGRDRVVGDFAARLHARWPSAYTAWTKSEGSPSADGRYWCFMVDDQKWQGVGVFTWDLANDSIVAMHDLEGHRPDHVSMSPSGSHCVVSFASSRGTIAYSRDFSRSRKLHGTSEHSDLAINAKGEDVYVAIDYQGSGGPVFMVNLNSGERTDLFNTYVAGTVTALHVSAKAYSKPGWVLVSTYADRAARGNSGPQWMHRRIFAMSLEARPRFLHLAHHQSVHTNYWNEPQASVNRDFTRVVFNSNWGVRSDSDMDMYMIALPPTLIPAPR